MSTLKIDYRPEIDGLRAIAVFSVIIYHAKISIYGFEFLKGGFLGVDIFFVISGYLITSLILKEFILTNKFSFINFYQRRVRRILPILFFIIAFSLPIAYLTLLPNQLVDFTKSILYSIGFTSNYYFYFSGKEYSAIEQIFNPFLHTWSLSVEEQFYLIIPIIYFFIFSNFKNKFLFFFIFFFLISFSFSIIETETNPSKSFYFIHTRLWELMAGSIVAYLENKNYFYKIKTNVIISSLFVNFSFITLFVTFLLFNHDTKHPSFSTIYPIISTCLILIFLNKKQLIGKILSSKIPVFLGLISYSLYLWHYPIFSFYRVYFLGNSIFTFLIDKILIIVSIFSLSILSYFFIEKVFRSKKIKFYNVILFLFFNFFIVLIFSINSIKSNGFEKRIPDDLKNKLSIVNFFSKEYRECFVKFNFKINKYCKFGDYKDNIVLIGDSRSAFLINDLKQKILKEKKNLNILTIGKIQFFNNNDRHNYVLEKSMNFENSILIINGLYNNPKEIFKFSQQEDQFINFFNIHKKKNNKIIFLSPIPVIENPYNFSQGNMRLVNMFKKNKIINFKIKKEKHINDSNEYKNFKQFVESKTQNVYFVNLDDIFCDKIYCYSIRDGYLLLQDKYHQSAYTSKIINDTIIEKIRSIDEINTN